MAKITRSELTKLVHQIRDGKAKLSEGETDQIYWCRDIFKGFGIRLLDSGSAAWIWQHKTWGRTHREVIGDVKILDLPEAQDTAKRAWAKVLLERFDPQKARAEARKAADITFGSVAEAFLAMKLPTVRPNTAKPFKRYLIGWYSAPLHSLPLEDVTHQQIQLQVDRIATKAGTETARRFCTPMNLMFDWAIKKEYHPGPNPMLKIDQPKSAEARKRILVPSEIRSIWCACEAWEEYALSGKYRKDTIPDHSRAVRLLFLTGCRASEIGGLEWSEVDFVKNGLNLSGTRTKNAIDHFVPLTDTALDILRSIERRPDIKYVFGASPHHWRTKELAKNGLYMNDLNTRLNKFIIYGVGRMPYGSGGRATPSWTLHDIRRTVRTGMAELGIDLETAERVLGHRIGGKVLRTYDRYAYAKEKRFALERWEEHLLHIIRGAEKKVELLRANRG